MSMFRAMALDYSILLLLYSISSGALGNPDPSSIILYNNPFPITKSTPKSTQVPKFVKKFALAKVLKIDTTKK